MLIYSMCWCKNVINIMKSYKVVFIYPCQMDSTVSSWRTEHTLWGQSITKTFIWPNVIAWWWLLKETISETTSFSFLCVCCDKMFEFWITWIYFNFDKQLLSEQSGLNHTSVVCVCLNLFHWPLDAHDLLFHLQSSSLQHFRHDLSLLSSSSVVL